MMRNILRYKLLLFLLAFAVVGAVNASAADSDVYIIYKDSEGSVITTDKFVAGYTFNDDYPVFDTGLQYKNMGWNTKQDGSGTTYATGAKLEELSADLTVYAMLKEGNFVRFESNGGTPIKYQFILPGGKATKPADPTKSGYSFAGWFTDNGTFAKSYDFDTEVKAETKLFAKWTPNNNTKYTVRIWLEKAEHSGTTTASDYTYYGSFQKAGTTEGAVSFNNTAGSADMSNSVVQAAIMSHTSPDNFPLFFNDNDANSNALTLTNDSKQQIAVNGGIAGDGSTVFNVYFRRVYLNFTLDDGDILGDGHFKETHQMRNGESVKAWLQRYNISVKQSFMDIMSQSTLTLDYQYQQTIYNLSSVSLYSTAHDITCLATACSFVNLYGLLSDGYRTSLVDNIGWELKLKSAPKGKNQFDIQYFYETVESAIAGNETDFRQYKESDFNKGGELLYNRPDISEWDGFSFNVGAGFSKYFIQSRDDDGNYGKIKLKNGDIINGTPMEWNSGTGSFQSFTKFGQRLKFYYIRNRYDLSFATNIGSITIPSISIVYGDAIKNHKDAVKYTDETGEHYLIPDQTTYRDDKYVIWVFKGWYDNELFLGNPIDFSTTTKTMPAENIHFYAKWEKKKIDITYDPESGNMPGKDPGEKEKEKQDSGDIPKYYEPIPPEGMTFLCWTLGGQYYDFTDPISEDATLIAMYTSAARYQITYSVGEGSGTAPADSNSYMPKAKTNIMQPSDVMIPPKNCQFDYWKDTDGKKYTAGSSVTMTGNIALTAVYKQIAADITIRKSGMKKGESAIFTVTKKGESAIFTVTKKGENAPLYTVPLTVNDSTGSAEVKLENVLFGEYTVEETSWSWAYEKLDPKTQDISKNNKFTFANKPKDTPPPHAEANVNNKLEKKKSN